MLIDRPLYWIAALLSTAVLWAATAYASTGAVGGIPLPPVEVIQERINKDLDLAERLSRLKAEVQPLVSRHRSDPEWLVSRLQMYWQGKHTQVYVRNSLYERADGQAPVPTVRFTGGRDTATAYQTPKLEDVKPYMGENDRLWLQRRDASQVWEWVEQSKSGRIIESINRRIAEHARDAAFLYWLEGNEDAGRMAFDVLDTYLSGMYYRELPIDLRKGHDQTIVGLQSYEVIHEEIVVHLTEAYAMLGSYVDRQGPDKRVRFDAALKKWADVLLLNGVPWNNWNLIKARFVLQIGSVLRDDSGYQDGKGRQHYVRAVIDGHGPRHWGLKRLLDFGYDPVSAMWAESAAYAVLVFDQFVECLDLLDRLYGIDLSSQLSLLFRAANVFPQYLLPNGRLVGFGDTRYDLINTHSIEKLLTFAQRHGRTAEVSQLRQVLAALLQAGSRTGSSGVKPVHAIMASGNRFSQDSSDLPVSALQSPTFYSSNTSWLIQRNGYAAPHHHDALVVSMVSANGNHAHANGLAMELFAKGMSLAPESGRGSGYFQSDFADYYSQFPAHNTVVVDGISAYPPMKIQHPFKVLGVYPKPNTALQDSDPRITMAEVGFIEPSTHSDQRRLMATVRVDSKRAYVLDVFRSRRRDGGDRYHDYIFHGLGQGMRFVDQRHTLATAPSDRLSFADGDLHGYDYWSDRQSLKREGPLQAEFSLAMEGQNLGMRLWLQGSAQREFFSVKAPPSTSWPRGMLGQGLDELPSPTLVIRQTGPAWDRPFALIMEPFRQDQAPAISEVRELRNLKGPHSSVALEVSLADGRFHRLISNGDPDLEASVAGIGLRGRFAMIGVVGERLERLFMAGARSLSAHGIRLECLEVPCSASFWSEGSQWLYSSDAAIRISWPQQSSWPARAMNGQTAAGSGRRAVTLPAAGPTRVF